MDLKRLFPRSVKRAVRIGFATSLPVNGRLQLLAVERLQKRPGHHDDAAINLGSGRAFLSGSDLYIDYVTFFGIFVDELFKSDYSNTQVIDLGAHCGYFGAYALSKGAACVYSYEPHSGNYNSLVRSAATFRQQGYCWMTERSAVGSADGEVALNVSSQSWSHSIYAPATGYQVGVEQVPMRSFSSILQTVCDAAAGAAILVKINIEGAAGDVVLGTSVDLWDNVAEVIFDCEPNGPYDAGQLIDHLEKSGLVLRPARGRLYRLSRR